MSNNCTVIGTVAEFGNWQAFRELARVGSEQGLGDIIDTCDVLVRYQAALKEETVVSLFRDTNGNLRSPLWLFARTLPFLTTYPSSYEASPLQKGISNKSVEMVRQVLENYYSKLTGAHLAFNIPYFQEEDLIFKVIYESRALVGDTDGAMAAILWACSSFSFPDEFFKSFIVPNIIGLHLVKEAGSGTADSFSKIEQDFKIAALPHRMAIIDQINGQISQEVAVVKIPHEGDIVPVEGVIQEAANHKVSLVFFWSPNCSLCEEVMPIVGRMDQRLKTIQGGVIGVTLSTIEKENIESAKQKNNASWFDVIISEDDAIKANPWGTVPRFYVIDRGGKILSIISGDECDLESVIENEIKKSAPSFGTITSI